MLEKFKMDYRRLWLSSDICRGLICRDEALRVLEVRPYDEVWVNDICEYVAKKFRISTGELHGYLAREPRTYKDFPNNKKFIEICYNIYINFFNSSRT